MNQPLVFYYRDGCHLCEDMWHQLREIQEQRCFDIVWSNVDADAELIERFGTLIPVLAAGEQIICNYYLDPIALEQYLDSLALDRQPFSLSRRSASGAIAGCSRQSDAQGSANVAGGRMPGATAPTDEASG